jgi:2-polyprenyl-6-methoxyphenol hydroxylase-like FAD-dependent oxidoreductase
MQQGPFFHQWLAIAVATNKKSIMTDKQNTSHSAAFDTPILIAGGGPVGMALAAELGYQGQSCMVIERRNGVVSHPKMNMISTRTMEFARRWGFARELREKAWPVDHPLNVSFITSLTGHEIASFHFPAYEDRVWPHTPEGHQRCSQLWFDPMIQKRALESGTVDARFRTVFKGFEQDSEGVTALIENRDTGLKESIRARYLIGCDGADSMVREELGITFPESKSLSYDVNIFFESQELLELHKRFMAMMYWVYDENGYWAQFISVDGRGLWRISMVTPELVTDFSDFDYDAFIRKAVGAEVAYKLNSLLAWERHRRVANSYRKGRVFLCGDACHQYSPTGGLGMNTGIQEAVDLAWKLNASLAGWGGEKLLDSYETERRPVAIYNNEAATSNFLKLISVPCGPEIEADTPEGERIRAQGRKLILENDFNEEYEQEGITVGYRYDTSPICVPDGTPMPPVTTTTITQTARSGARAPHAWVDEKSRLSTLDLFGRGFVLLRLGANPLDAAALQDAARAVGMPVTVHDLTDAAIAELYACRLALVRPDGHVAWRGDAVPADASGVIDVVRGA